MGGEPPGGVQGGPGPEHRRESPVRVDRDPTTLAPGNPAADVLQVPCLLQAHGHVVFRAVSQEPQPGPHRLRFRLGGYPLEQRVLLHRSMGSIPGDHDRAILPQVDPADQHQLGQ